MDSPVCKVDSPVCKEWLKNRCLMLVLKLRSETRDHDLINKPSLIVI